MHSSFEELIQQTTSPVIITKIDQSISSLRFTTEKSTFFELLRRTSTQDFRFRVFSFEDFKAIEPEQIPLQIEEAFYDFGRLFCNNEFYKDLHINISEDFKHKYKNISLKNTFPITSYSVHTVWFLWLRNYIFNSLRFSNHMFMDIPFMFLFVCNEDQLGDVLQMKTECLNRGLPNIHNFQDINELNKFYYSNVKFSLIIICKDKNVKINIPIKVMDGFSKIFTFSENDSFDEFKEIMKQLISIHFINNFNILKTKYFKYTNRKSIFKENMSLNDLLTYTTYEFSIGNYEKAYNAANILLNKNGKENYIEYITFIKVISYILLFKDDCSYQSFESNICEIINFHQRQISHRQRVARIVIFFSALERFNFNPTKITAIFGKIIHLTGSKSSKRLMLVLRGVWYEEMALYCFKFGFKRRITFYLLEAAISYHKSDVKGHDIRCFTFVQSLISGFTCKSNPCFICGNIKNEYFSTSEHWRNLSNFALWKLAQSMVNIGEYKSWLYLILILISSPTNAFVPDEKIFSLIHYYFQSANIGKILKVENVPLVLIDQENILFSSYGDFISKNFDKKDFEDLIKYHKHYYGTSSNYLGYWKSKKNIN